MEHSHAQSFIYCLWLLSTYDTKLGSCNRDCVACHAQNIYSLAFYKKYLPDSALECFLISSALSKVGVCS